MEHSRGGLGFVWLRLAFRGGASGKARLAQPYVFPSSLEAASRQREELSSAREGKLLHGRGGEIGIIGGSRSAVAAAAAVTAQQQHSSRNSDFEPCGV